MTAHVFHTNNLIGNLKQQYRSRIDQLQNKIQQQQNEIEKLNMMITLMDKELNKEYDF
jgi:uncharacterized coiled-coil protein SlyX